MMDSETLEAVAVKLETMAGNSLYRSAWRKAAKVVRSMKVLKGQAEILNDSAEQISSASSGCR